MRRNPCWGILIGRQENHRVVIVKELLSISSKDLNGSLNQS